MADNVQITPGAGALISTEEVTTLNGGAVTAQQVQRVANAVRTADGVAVDLPGDSTNGLDVDVTRLPAGENHVGEVGGKTAIVTTTFFRPADTAVYAAGDAVTNSTTSPTAMTFSGAARINGGSGVIVSVVLCDTANQATKPQFELWLFDALPGTIPNDNAAFTPNDTILNTVISVVPLNVVYVGDAGASGNSILLVQGLSIPFKCASGSTSLYGLLVVKNAYTPINTEGFTFRLGILQD